MNMLADSNECESDLNALGEQIAQRVSEIEKRDKIEAGRDLGARLTVLKQSISLVIYDFIRTGLFEKDKLTVGTIVTLKIMVDEGLLKQVYFDVIMRCRASDEVANRGSDLAKWLSELSWARLKAIEDDLRRVDTIFENLTEKIAADCDDWEEWYNHSNPEQQKMPGDFEDLTGLPRLIIMRVLRPDRLPVALSDYIREILGEEFVNQPPFSMATTYRYTTAKTPVLFVLYPGVDPTSWVEDLGRQRGKPNFNTSVSHHFLFDLRLSLNLI
jgi:dynein heavy chain